eukprot:scaffold69169_cov66-Phaeocystis_antarctica.AAC.3
MVIQLRRRGRLANVQELTRCRDANRIGQRLQDLAGCGPRDTCCATGKVHTHAQRAPATPPSSTPLLLGPSCSCLETPWELGTCRTCCAERRLRGPRYE